MLKRFLSKPPLLVWVLGFLVGPLFLWYHSRTEANLEAYRSLDALEETSAVKLVFSFCAFFVARSHLVGASAGDRLQNISELKTVFFTSDKKRYFEIEERRSHRKNVSPRALRLVLGGTGW